MTSVLEITVFDEDRDHKVEFLGRIAIPLLRIHNGEKRWYTLKDKKMFSRAKGNSPQVCVCFFSTLFFRCFEILNKIDIRYCVCNCTSSIKYFPYFLFYS